MLSVTPAHALQTESGEWVAAGQLEKGAQLRSINGIVSVDSVFTESVSPTPVISYELEGGLDYVVGEMPVVVAQIYHLKSVVEAYGSNKAAFKALIKDLSPTQRSALIKGIAEIEVKIGNTIDVSASIAKREEFIAAFVADANFAQGIAQDASLIKTWSGVVSSTINKSDIVFLNWAKKLKYKYPTLDFEVNTLENLLK